MSAQEKIAEAAEVIASAETAQAEAAEERAEALESVALAQATETTVAAAEAATALAATVAASAQMQAAEEIRENESELAWLRTQYEEQNSVIQAVASRLENIDQTFQGKLSELSNSIMNMMQSLTPQPSPEITGTTINPLTVKNPENPAPQTRASKKMWI